MHKLSKIKNQLFMGCAVGVLAIVSATSIGFSAWTLNQNANGNAAIGGDIGSSWVFDGPTEPSQDTNAVVKDKNGKKVEGAVVTVDPKEGLTSIDLSQAVTKSNLNITLPSTYVDANGNTHTVTSCGANDKSVFPYDYFANWVSKITIPNTYTNIGKNAFNNSWNSCAATLEFEEGDQDLVIGDYAFYLNAKLTNVNFPSRLTKLGVGAFGHCESLTTVDLSETKVTVISDSCFRYAYKLKKINWPTNLVSIGSYAFATNSSGSLNLSGFPVTFTTLGDHAFYDCQKLSSVDFSTSSLTTIGSYAFLGDSELKSVTLPATVTSIGTQAFASCYKLSSIKFLGTMAQWNAISFGSNWKYSGLNKVTCSDGTISI
jgi:hypothetical protein